MTASPKITRVSTGFLLLRVGLVILITVHILIPGMILYADLVGYLCLIAALVLLLPVSKKLSLAAGTTLAGFILSIAAYIIFAGEGEADPGGPLTAGILNIVLSTLVAMLDLASIYMICKSFQEKGLELKNAEICRNSSELLRYLAGAIGLLLLNSFQGVWKLPRFLRFYLSGGAKLFLLMCMIYVYMYLSAMLRVMKQSVEIRELEVK